MGFAVAPNPSSGPGIHQACVHNGKLTPRDDGCRCKEVHTGSCRRIADISRRGHGITAKTNAHCAIEHGPASMGDKTVQNSDIDGIHRGGEQCRIDGAGSESVSGSTLTAIRSAHATSSYPSGYLHSVASRNAVAGVRLSLGSSHPTGISNTHRLALDAMAQFRTKAFVRDQVDRPAKEIFEIELDPEEAR